MTTLEQAIIKAVPDIMELTLGCVIEQKGCLPEPVAKVYPNVIQTGITGEMWHKNDITILGRPITLADVLRAVRANQPELYALRGEGEEEYFESKYNPSKEYPLYWEPNILRLWDLTTDLSGQSDECRDFLESILCQA